MRLALISDIHANLEALTAVLKDIEKQNIDEIICLGDVIGYGSDPVACLEQVNRTCKVKLMGNHEYAALGLLSTDYYHTDAKKAAQWTLQQLSDREYSMISDYEMDNKMDNIYLVHSSPHEPEMWHYILDQKHARLAFDYFEGDICFHGHSHVPMIFLEIEDKLPRMQIGHDIQTDQDNRYLINVGSVGQPRDDDPRACYVILDTKEDEVFFNRIEYDINTVQQKMKNVNLPEMLINRLSVGK